MNADHIYDVAISPSRNGKYEGVVLRFPSEIARALVAKEYTRMTIAITEDGLLLRPYKGGKGAPVAALPDWDAP